MPSDLELRLERLLQADPDPDVETRLRAAALAALPARRRGVRLPDFLRARRRVGPLVVVGLLIVGGSALAALLLSGGSATDPRRAALVSPEAQSRLEATPALADAPWLLGPGGPPRIDAVAPRPSLVFTAGTGYRKALQSFYDAVSRGGALPSSARLGSALPAGVVVRLPVRGGPRLALDLRAPFGYDVRSGRIHPPAYASLRGATFPPSDRYGTPLRPAR